MSIVMEDIDGMACPIIRCDTCGERIDANHPGLVAWATQYPNPFPIFAHKAPACDTNPDHGWNDLDVWLHYVIQNAGVRMDKDVAFRAEVLEAGLHVCDTPS